MADTTPAASVSEADNNQAPQAVQPRPLSRYQQLNQIYALPAPLRTFPLPTFVPHNPLSLFHILYVWISHAIKPQASHFEQLYQGLFSPDTRSVHVTDVRSIRGLWEQGFYGKGTLSRSEPSWLDREKARRGAKIKTTSEENTRQRRAERQQTKWERARKEREAIDQKLLEEAALNVRENEASSSGIVDAPVQVEILQKIPIRNNVPFPPPVKSDWTAPVGPLELLSLPNSNAELEVCTDSTSIACVKEYFDEKLIERFYAPPVGPLELLALPNALLSYPTTEISSSSFETLSTSSIESSGVEDELLLPPDAKVDGNATITSHALEINGHATPDDVEVIGGSETNEDTFDESTHSEDTTETNVTPPNGSALSDGRPLTSKMKRQKSVRFSPMVEKNTFIQSEPPSPERAATASKSVEEEPVAIKDQEHLQLTLEEAFFLSYSLGAISISDPETQSPISNQDLFYLFRKTSYFPPRLNPSLSTDDPFMMNYVVYHHYRSLGWVIRSGIKFSVDYMLYNRGPVFSHAEFAVLLLPSYSDPYWTSDPFLEKYSSEKQKRTWAWMSCINRVINQVKKTLILTYVDIPKPLSVEEEQNLGIDGVLARYKIREIVMKRFAANRMRD